MAKAITDDIEVNIKQLINKITNYEINSPEFQNVEKRIVTTIKNSDTMYFSSFKDIKTAICSMAEKFSFHGFYEHSDYLKSTYEKYIDESLTESELTPRLNIVKFLLCMSQSPTTQFWQNPEEFNFIKKTDKQDEDINWGEYLKEGIERWSPCKDTTDSESTTDDEEYKEIEEIKPVKTTFHIKENEKPVEKYDFKDCQNKLKEMIQHSWFKTETIVMKPPSDWFDANVGILFEEHLAKQSHYLVPFDPVSIISEYKVIREILWQMWNKHKSTVFYFNGNKIKPKENVTIASVISTTCENFLKVFLPYIEVLDFFRSFYKSVFKNQSSITWMCYASATKKITQKVYNELIDIENEAREQETTLTLLKLARRLELIFEPVMLLKQIHDEVVIEGSSNFDTTINLLRNLHKSFACSISKMEQDMKMFLYIESLYYYLSIVDSWLVRGILYDHTLEFPILNNNIKRSEKYQSYGCNYELKTPKIDDGFLQIIIEHVFPIGRNLHLLILLGKYDGIITKRPESIYKEFVRRFLEELAIYYNCEVPEIEEEIVEVRKIPTSFELNQMGDWSDYVDTNDGFLFKAFEDFHMEKIKIKPKETLFEKIGKITTNLFPLRNLPEKIFTDILKDRFTISGLVIKNLLIEKYNLDKQFEFLNSLYLFWDDLISPFYRRLFINMNTPNCDWGNPFWLTSHLQDVLMDPYPNFFEDCCVKTKENWKQCRDSLEALTLLSIHYNIQWPLNIVITEKHLNIYHDFFELILKLKWALNTVNHLYFKDLGLKIRLGKPSKLTCIIRQLIGLRFHLINILNTIQHYLFGFVLSKAYLKFQLDFEKSNDLKSLIESYETFFQTIHQPIVEIRNKKINEYGFYTLLKSVKMLKIMWNDIKFATNENLDKCYRIYKTSFEVVNPLITPVFVY